MIKIICFFLSVQVSQRAGIILGVFLAVLFLALNIRQHLIDENQLKR
jgi:hypothetical protein